MKNVNGRTTKYDIEDIFLNRYSPRALSGKIVSKNELMTILDAARWAPSAFNNQSWRFLYAFPGSPDFDLFFSFLNDGNKIWSKKAGALVIIFSKKTSDDGRPSPTHSFDAGAAWENLALQAAKMKIIAHGMSGFNHEMVVKELNIKDDYVPEAMVALGFLGDAKDLPEQLQALEKPNQRKKLEEVAFEGKEGANKF